MTRALLALLLAEPNRRISTERLVEELWGGRPPASAESALRVHISHLRKALTGGEAGQAVPIQASGGGYRVVVATEALDALRFEAALGRAREAAEAGAPREVANLIEPALASWRGPAYADLHHLEALRAEAVRLEELRLTALELLVDADLTLGRAATACDILAPAVGAYPLRESLTERFMLALYQAGRGSEALRACGQLRTALDRELGVPPGPAIRALEDAIVLQSPHLDRPHGVIRAQPAALAETSSVVGRRAEIAAIMRVWEAVATGASKLVLVAGPAGIGKSTLAEEVARRATGSGALVLVGNCDPDPASDFDPFPQFIRKIVAAGSATDLKGPALGDLRVLVPDLADRLPMPTAPANPAAGRERLFAAVGALLSRASDAPLMLVAEDLHWASREALALLRHVLRQRDRRTMVLGTYRDDEAALGSPLYDALSRGRLSQPDLTIALDGLDVAEVAALVQADAPEQLQSRLMTGLPKLHEVTSGNPLFVREVLRELSYKVDTPLDELAPGGVRALVERRLARLSVPARQTVSAAAVLGRRFSLPQVVEIAGLLQADVLDVVEELVRAGLIAEGTDVDHFTFVHPLVRNVIYRSISHSRRARLHLRAADVLEAQRNDVVHGGSAEPARHLLAALPLGTASRAASFARRAGEEAAQRFAFDEAAYWYRQAIDLAGMATWTHHDEASTLLALGETLERAGQREDARTAYINAAAKARVAGDAQLLADIAIAATPRYVTIDEFHPVQRSLVDEALAGLADEDERRRAWLLSCAGASRYYTDGSDEPFATQALTLARASNDPEAQAAGLLTYHRWLTHDAGAAVERLLLSRELRRLCEREHLDDLVGKACRELLVDLLTVGRHAEFDVELDRLAYLAATHAVPADQYWVSAFRATRALMSDPDDEAETLVRAASTLGRQLQQADAVGVSLLQTFALRYQQGRSNEIVAQLTAPAVERPRLHAGLALMSSALVAVGRTGDAQGALDTVVHDGELELPRDNMWLAAAGLFGGVAAVVGSASQRGFLAETLAPFGDQWCVFGAGAAVFGTVHHWLARLAGADQDHRAAAHHGVRALSMSEPASAYWTNVAQGLLVAVAGEQQPA